MIDTSPSTAILVTCIAFLGVLSVGYWIEKRVKQRRTPCKVELVRFYSREMCKAAHALSNDSLEDQAQNLIKHIDKEWRLKHTGENDACTW